MVSKDLVHRQPLIKGVAYDAHYAVVRELNEFTSKVSSEILQHSNLTTSLKPGFVVSAGQQYSMLVKIRSSGFEDVVLRFYVPPEGYPVTMSYMGHEEVAHDEEQLIKALYETIPENQGVQSKLRAFLAIGRGHSGV
jgi:hypothetical protein